MLSARLRSQVAIAATAICLIAAPAPAADYYAGKSIDFIIGSDVGGGYDIYVRVISRHLNRFIPGNPTIVPKNQPGAGSGRAASLIYGVAPKDGTVIGAVFPGAIMAPLLDDRAQPLYDPTKFQYLGSADNATRLCITHARSRIKIFDDALKEKAIMGSSAAGGSTRDYVNMLKKTTGVLFDLVGGYKGTADIFLAMERGEVDGMCGLDWASLKSQRPDWVRDRTVNILAQSQSRARGGADEARRPANLEICAERGRQEGGRADHRPAGVRPPLSRAARRGGGTAGASARGLYCDHAGQGLPRRRRAHAHRRGAVLGRAGAAAGGAALRLPEGNGRAGEGSGQTVTR